MGRKAREGYLLSWTGISNISSLSFSRNPEPGGRRSDIRTDRNPLPIFHIHYRDKLFLTVSFASRVEAHFILNVVELYQKLDKGLISLVDIQASGIDGDP